MTEPVHDQLKTVKQIATYLNVNERTVLKLVSEGALPGLRVGNQWRFRQAMVDAWLDDQALGLTPQYVRRERQAPAARVQLELEGCFRAEHILPELAAKTKTTVIAELAAFAHELGLVRDRTWFVGALIERENVMPTATGHVAFLHTLRRHPEQVLRPFMILGRSRAGIAFDSLDRKPTHLFFVLGLHYEELHLPWLARLSELVARPSAVETLLQAPGAGAIHRTLAQAGRGLG